MREGERREGERRERGREGGRVREGEGGKEGGREGERRKCIMGKRPGNCYIHSISHKQPTNCLGY